MWDSSHTHTHHTINQIWVSQFPSLKSLTSSLRPTLQGSVSKPTHDYWVDSDTMCNESGKSTNHLCTIPQKDQSQLRFLVIVNKTQIYPVNTRCGTHYTPTHITQSIKLGHHIVSMVLKIGSGAKLNLPPIIGFFRFSLVLGIFSTPDQWSILSSTDWIGRSYLVFKILFVSSMLF